MHKKLLYTNKYKQPVYALYQEPYNQQPQPANNMVKFTDSYQEPVNQTLEYIPNFPRTRSTEFGPGNFNQEQYQNAITRDSTELNNYIQDNPISSYFMGSNQESQRDKSISGSIQVNREWLHKLKGFNNADTREAAAELNQYQEPVRQIRTEDNKYMQYKQPTLRYQDTTIDYSTAVGTGDTSLTGSSDTGGAQGSGNDMPNSNSMGDLNAYANLAGQLANGMKDPSAGANLNPNMNLQTQGNTKIDGNITQNPDEAITFSDQFRGNSLSPNQISQGDFKSIIDGQVPPNKSNGEHLMAGGQMAMTGAQVGGPVGAIVGFAVGTGMSMYGNQKNSDARQEIAGNLTAQNSVAFASGVNQQRENNNNELARFLV